MNTSPEEDRAQCFDHPRTSHDDNVGKLPDLKALLSRNKMFAFRALKQGLKFHYGTWRMWMNYTIVAIDVGKLVEACRAQPRSAPRALT